jgi:hypothetical protein
MEKIVVHLVVICMVDIDGKILALMVDVNRYDGCI